MIRVGLIGIGGMGRAHFACYDRNPGARVAAICTRSAAKLRGDWSGIELNLDPDARDDAVDLSGIATTTRIEEVLADPAIDAVDICLPTPLRAATAVAALRAGKHVLCEKPMALSVEQCEQMEAAAVASGKQLMIGHCLRYWPEYVAAHRHIASGEWGRVLRADLFRSAGVPGMGWMRDSAQSGGFVLDMHIHDVDAALWWFGAPDAVEANGFIRDGLPLACDATWRYDDGPLVTLRGAWNPHGAPFRMGFGIVMERASLLFESATGSFQLWQGGAAQNLPVPEESAYCNQINDFVACLNEGRIIERVTPASSRRAVEMARRELAQIAGKNA